MHNKTVYVLKVYFRSVPGICIFWALRVYLLWPGYIILFWVVHVQVHCLQTFNILDVFFLVFRQIAYPKGCIVTLIAFVWLFPTVHFQMLPQIAYLKRCKITLVTFV